MFTVTNTTAKNMLIGYKWLAFIFYTCILEIEQYYQKRMMQNKQKRALLYISEKMKGSIKNYNSEGDRDHEWSVLKSSIV